MNQQPGQQNVQNLNTAKNQRKEEQNVLKERAEPIEIPNVIESMPLEITDLPKLEPFKGIEMVAATTCLIAVLSSECSEGSPSKFVVYDMFLKPVLYAHEESGMFSKSCKRNTRDFDIHLCDSRRTPILSSSRTGGGYCACGSDVQETWHKNQKVGVAFRSVFDKYLYLKLGNSGFAIPTGAGGPFNTCMKAKNNGPFPVSAQGGLKVAEILRLESNLLNIADNVECIMVHFPIDMPPIVKLLILQVSFLIDYTNFDDQQGGGKKGGTFEKIV